MFETDNDGEICFKPNTKGLYTRIYPHEILLLVKAGILEEYDETFPKIGDEYYFIDSNCFIDCEKTTDTE